jgi:hypothetical protein
MSITVTLRKTVKLLRNGIPSLARFLVLNALETLRIVHSNLY